MTNFLLECLDSRATHAVFVTLTTLQPPSDALLVKIVSEVGNQVEIVKKCMKSTKLHSHLKVVKVHNRQS